MEVQGSSPHKSESEFAPKFVTDLKQIESLSYKNAQENFEFSKWLKTQDPAMLDETVKQISTQVSAGIDCTICANCCKSLIVSPQYNDLNELANRFQMTTFDFKKKYMKKDIEGELVFNQRPCPFLKDNMCSVYSNRPGLCRNYPYLDEGNIVENMGRLLGNMYICPIAFNTFELLKLKFT